MKGIILAGGMGTRLYQITKVVIKQLLPVYDKPMIYYPLSTLMLAGIRDIMLICKLTDLPLFENLLGDGSDYGLNIQYKVQDQPNGIPEAFVLGEEFIGQDNVCLILGDNIFYGHLFPDLLKKGISTVRQASGAVIFGHNVSKPQNYGIVKTKKDNTIINIEEKPKKPKSNCAVVGLYMYDNSVVEKAKNLTPSERGETEITDINKKYLKENKLKLLNLGRGYTWFDAGIVDSFMEASNFVQTIQKRQGLKISCIEEVAYYMNFIDAKKLKKLASGIKNPEYSEYLLNLLKEREN